MVQQHIHRGLSCSRCWKLLQGKGPWCPWSFHFALSPLFRDVHWQQLLQLNSFPIQFTEGLCLLCFLCCFFFFPPDTNFTCSIYKTVQKESSMFLDIETTYLHQCQVPEGGESLWHSSQVVSFQVSGKKKVAFDSYINMLKTSLVTQTAS